MVYKNSLCKIFKSPYSIGIIGGKPNSSYYFVGFQDDELVYLDPHKVQEISKSSKVIYN
jgi:cysteine protease ATG4